jgi:hypothetical protein
VQLLAIGGCVRGFGIVFPLGADIVRGWRADLALACNACRLWTDPGAAP